ncbi:A/G-specific adenine glycosylase [Lacticaseibacillus casei]|uniref:Adenine DNA glycosylase n=1 Tax=Lacticaseibacillus huelsenbergensis TaxID=3035291 RepID=A0ABY8E049_9LACO|nr:MULTISPECIES: A/G-specific adenine glycosylase [Lacticaseibacillus]MDG3062618.1 A/G-specific adenine glycosylase [Lacticaseibacillus sp. BCRC 81376]QVI38774.1 A/G-specific adenine glycosylase [Lacticaseibacillus casei]WFB40658.1 A/G-specific adenine glycosylase [Lacticaseibacillus huelsenbergensis]WFB43404.1 A/G-specific adenine glycosylase [Lacticaseibacillus huelsenbergensis]
MTNNKLMDWPPEKVAAFQQALLDWYDGHARTLPWRQDHDPYHVMVSELMLQQTQVQTVIPYYKRFMTQFPTVEALAAAPEAAVLKAWEGLGYYSRARRLQQAAKQIVNDYGGKWPQTSAELQTLAGIGPYTAGAIASISFGEVVPAIDGNAFRVFARLFKVDADIARPQTRQVFYDLIRPLIPKDRPGDFNQAVMDLGSSYMSASHPDPEHSPVRDFDASYRDGVVADYPVKTKKPRPVVHRYFALVVRSDAGYLFEQRPSTGMLADLWMFPLIDMADLEATMMSDQLDEVSQTFAASSGLALTFADLGVKQVQHTFTHQRWQMTLIGADAKAEELKFIPARWVAPKDFGKIALPTVQKKLNQALGLDDSD